MPYLTPPSLSTAVHCGVVWCRLAWRRKYCVFGGMSSTTRRPWRWRWRLWLSCAFDFVSCIFHPSSSPSHLPDVLTSRPDISRCSGEESSVIRSEESGPDRCGIFDGPPTSKGANQDSMRHMTCCSNQCRERAGSIKMQRSRASGEEINFTALCCSSQVLGMLEVGALGISYKFRMTQRERIKL